METETFYQWQTRTTTKKKKIFISFCTLQKIKDLSNKTNVSAVSKLIFHFCKYRHY